jgi:hypothetical protein
MRRRENATVSLRYGCPFAALFTVLILLLSGTANAAINPHLRKEIEKEIMKVRKAKTVDARTDAADRLARLTYGVDPTTVDDKTVADIASLLDSPDDSVRGRVAGALGDLGPRAKVAAPKLLAILPKAYCEPGALPSWGAITLALQRMGIKPPPPPKECMGNPPIGVETH